MANFRPGEEEKVQGELIEKTIKCPKTNGFMSKGQQIIFLGASLDKVYWNQSR